MRHQRGTAIGRRRDRPMAQPIRFSLPLALALAIVPGVTLSQGTVKLADLDTLLRQKPQIHAFLTSAYTLDPSATAAVRFGPQFKNLGGARMGPYTIRARPKTPRNAAALEIVLCTEARFFDASGKETSDQFGAARVEERLAAMMLREAGSKPAIPSCP
jgi:hypothetical protein